MINAIKPRPSVPSGLAIPDSGSGHGSSGAEGAKNHWKSPSCHNSTTLTLACYNARTLRTDERFLQFEQETEHIKWDIIGLSEVRRKGEELVKLDTGHLFYYRGHEDTSYGGVGFLFKNTISPAIQNVTSISPRVCFVIVKISKRYLLKIIQVYAPTSASSDEEVEIFYDEINKALENTPCHFTTLMGDFNARVGAGINNEKFVGQFGLGSRNNRGQTLVNFLEQKKMFNMNTFFKKRTSRKWTWASPDGITKNEVDYIISSHKNVVTDVSVLARFKTGSDHRLVRATYKFNLKLERCKIIKSKRNYEKQDIAYLNFKDEYRTELKNSFDGLDELNLDVDQLNEALCKAVSETTRKHLGGVCTKVGKLSHETLALMQKRREMKHHTLEDQRKIEEVNHQISKAMKKDLRKHSTKIISQTIKNHQGPKVFRKKINSETSQIIKLTDENGHIVTDRIKMLSVVEKFYGDLYTSKSFESNSPNDPRAPPTENRSLENLPSILPCEVEKALLQMKNATSPGEDGITVELLRAGGQPVLQLLVKLFNKVLFHAKTPKAWKNATVTILHKKGDSSKLNNYRPISLLSQLYKTFSKVICNRLTHQLDECQPPEQAGFRNGFSTIDHIHTVKQLMEKSSEYNRPLCLAFIDYEKAFDSVEHWAVFNSLHRCHVDARYVDVLRELYGSATMQVRLHAPTGPITINRGVRQGDTISPKLFTAVLEDVMKTLAWDSSGIKINGVFLSHLRFADDLVLFANNIEDLQLMIQQLHDASLVVGLKMNMSKTKVMTNAAGFPNSDVMVGSKKLAVVDKYLYLGHILSFGKENQSKEVSRRIQLGWAAFGKLEDVFRSKKIPQCLKTRLYNQCVLPTMTYGAETWALTKKTVYKVRVAQRAMERAMLGINLLDRVPNTEIRRQTKVQDVGTRVVELKWNWAGHLARRGDGRWSKSLTEWWPRTDLRSPGRPTARWVDDIKKVAGNSWMRKAQDREGWRLQREAYTQQWVLIGCR